MLPASNRGVGMNMGFPDVCLTPSVPAPIPVPYPNMALNAMAVPFALKVLLTMMNALNMGSRIPMTNGDEPGVAHPLFKQMGQYTLGNPKVLVEGLPAISLTCPTTGNLFNNPLGMVAVPSATNVFYTHRLNEEGRAVADRLDGAACARLGEEVTRAPVRATAHAEGMLQVTIARFARDVPAQLYALLRAERPRALLVDLRGSRGGLLHVAMDLAEDFLPAGLELLTVLDDDGDPVVYRTRREPAYTLPTAVLVDRHTASAAEIFAGALAAHGRAPTIGEQTYGKAEAASLVGTMGGGEAQYQTRARVLLPGGVTLTGGLLPAVPSQDPVSDGLTWLRSEAP